MFPVCKASPKSEKKWDGAFDIYASNKSKSMLMQDSYATKKRKLMYSSSFLFRIYSSLAAITCSTIASYASMESHSFTKFQEGLFTIAL